jgi:DNA-binding transcriptional LysR family regulator
METLILTQKGSKYRQIFKSYIKENQVELKSELEFGSVEVIKSFVKSGLGLGFLPKATIEREISSCELVELTLNNREFTITAQVLYREDKWMNPALDALMKMIEKI